MSNAYLDLYLVHPHPSNPRGSLGDLTELVESIRKHGILQPLTVRPHPTRVGHYEIVAGHRRYAAALLAGLDRVPVVVRGGAAGEGKVLELMLTENLHRLDLNPMDKAEAMGKLIRLGYKAAEIAENAAISPPTVSYHLALLELDERSREKVRSGQLAAADAVKAVRRARRERRGKVRVAGGKVAAEKRGGQPEHFSDRHPLSGKAEQLCDESGHPRQRRVGKTACGGCWETVIRQDERARDGEAQRHMAAAS